MALNIKCGLDISLEIIEIPLSHMGKKVCVSSQKWVSVESLLVEFAQMPLSCSSKGMRELIERLKESG